ncbi:jg15046 [Pararge aegeria aegeria]|uniref:Jg15046 protein n=2 Tax=Pararge aegeria TaxID=116150 RepID=A0A8S4QR00_9NEOP|nr:jg15046 [Pararge aegeria aegeria]
MSCPPPSPEVCPQVCPPTPPLPFCYVKPVMRCLHQKQTVKIIWGAMLLCALGGSCVYFFIGVPRRAKYKDYYA